MFPPDLQIRWPTAVYSLAMAPTSSSSMTSRIPLAPRSTRRKRAMPTPSLCQRVPRSRKIAYNFYAANLTPVVATINPAARAGDGGIPRVIITGSGFSDVTAVDLRQHGVDEFQRGLRHADYRHPAPEGTGVVDVTVTTALGGTSLTSPDDKFSYVPVVTWISPPQGKATGGDD